MPVLQILQWFLLVAEVLIAVPVLYLCLLSLSAILTTKMQKREISTPTTHAHFAILIPAHNEETILER